MNDCCDDCPYNINDYCIIFDDVLTSKGCECGSKNINPKSCEDFEIKLYWKIIRKLKRFLGRY